jgi:hypothetical protein
MNILTGEKMKKLALLFIANLLLAAYVFGAEKQVFEYQCDALKSSTGKTVANAPLVSVQEHLIPVGTLTPAFSTNYTLYLKPARGRAYKVSLKQDSLQSTDRFAMTYSANVSDGRWILIRNSDQNLTVAFRGSNRSYATQCVGVKDPMNDNLANDAISAARAHAQNKINTLMWVGAWIPKISSASIVRTQENQDNTLEFFVQVVLYFEGPTKHTSVWQYQVKTQNNLVQEVKFLND